MKYLLLILIMESGLSLAQLTPDQQRQRDSLEQIAQLPGNDTMAVWAYMELSTLTYYTDQELGRKYIYAASILAEQALKTKLSPESKQYHQVALALTWNNLGYIVQQEGKTDSGLHYLTKSANLQREIGDTLEIARALNNLGQLHKEKGDIPTCLEYFHRAIQLAEQVNAKDYLAAILSNVGLVYHEQNELDNALKFYNRSIDIHKELEDYLQLGDEYWNLAHIYSNQGDTTAYVQSLINAGKYYGKCKEIYCQGAVHHVEGVIANSRGDNETAITQLKKVLPFYRQLSDRSNLQAAYAQLTRNNINLKDFKQAELYGDSSLAIANALGYPRKINIAAKMLSTIYRSTNKWKEALESYELHVKMRDSLLNETNQKAVIRQQTKYEFEKAQLVKEQNEKERARIDNERTSRRDNLQYSVVLICLLAIAVLIAMLGRLALPVRAAEGLIFFAFLIFFEFVLVLADPYVDIWTGGAPGWKLLINAGIAGAIFPLHSFFEHLLKQRLVN